MSARDDRLALVTVVVGAVLAFAGWREPLRLGAGLCLGMGGSLLALRGDRAIDGRSWIRAAVAVAVLAAAAAYGVSTYADWIAGEWLSEGAQPGALRAELGQLQRTAWMLQVTSVAAGAGVLLGAVANRVRK